MSTEADQRALKIKTGTVRRLRKELGMYSEEVSRGTAKVAGMREEGADPYDIKYAENILAESTAMVPDTRQRLEAALRELAGLLEEAGGEVEGSEEAAAAREEVAAAQPLLE